MNKVDIHKRMIRHVFLNVELLLNDGIRKLSEYDIQSLMYQFFARCLLNSNFQADREKSGKVDCVLFEGGKETSFNELKTYFKKDERFSENDFHDDIKKLSGLLKKNRTTNGYFVIAALNSKLKSKAAKANKTVKSHLENDLIWHDYILKTGVVVRLRPSVKERRGLCCVMSWEVML
jgi:hypothetical protein